MGSKADRENLNLIRSIRRRIALIVFGVLGVFLFSSEFVNSIFNTRLDALGASFGERVAFSFKPTVVALFFVFGIALYSLILRYLQPLVRYLTTGEDYQRARSAASRVPWVIIWFQLIAWTIGTTVYYMISGWQASSGIPYLMGLLLKLGVGLPSAIYTAIIFNIILVPAKHKLRIVDLRPDENDMFSRNRDYFAIGAVLLFMTINYSYVVSYYAAAPDPITGSTLAVPLVFLGVFYALISFGLIALSKREYFLQVESIRGVLVELAAGKSAQERRIQITNFNELGELAGYVNSILATFADLFSRISATAAELSVSAQRLSTTGQQNAAHSNEQASSTAEIVSTMEGVNTLSADIGRQVREVEQLSAQVKAGVQEGFRITQGNILKMREVTESYADTIGGMKNLGEHIAGIWEIVKIINGIAGQIKIIAFNAALEASSAGDAGKNFEIVAGEIRRLADSTVASTNEIRSRIGDIQHASDALIGSSETDTLKIQDAAQMSNDIEQVFEQILRSSDATAGATTAMSEAVAQQINAFEQVLITSRQIAEGIHEFAESLGESSHVAETLEGTVATLNAIVARSSRG